MNGKIVAAKLHRVGNAISGAMGSPEILAKLIAYGYTLERLAKGKQLLDTANHLMTTLE
jgi:hypothetical protein